MSDDDTPWGQGESEESLLASPPRLDQRLEAEELLTAHQAALTAGRTIEAVLAAARHAGRSGEPTLLRALLTERAPALSEDAADERADAFVQMSGQSLFSRYPLRARAALPPAAMTALLQGGDPGPVLRQLAILCDQYGLPCLAADFIDAVVAMRPGWTPPLFNRALIKMSLGDFFAARGDIKVLRDAGDGDGELLQQYHAHLAGDWTFFPAVDQLADRDGVDVPDDVRILPTDLAELFDQQARHLAGIRRRLTELAGERLVTPSFVPPEVPFTGDAEETGGIGIPDLLSEARLVWSRMAVLAWITGHDQLARPAGPSLDDRIAIFNGWANEGMRLAHALADGEDPGPGEVPTWNRLPLTQYHSAFASMKLVPLFEELAGLADWLAGIEEEEEEDGEGEGEAEGDGENDERA